MKLVWKQPVWEPPVLRYDARYEVFVALKERMQASEHATYLLVDPMSRCDLQSLDALQRKKYVVDLERFGMDRDLCPYILSIQGANDELLKESINIAWERRDDWQQAQPICGWITSELQAPALAGSLLRQAVTSKAGCARQLNRFYDPRVARHARYSQGSHRSFSGAATWSQLGWDGLLQDLPCLNVNPPDAQQGDAYDQHMEWCGPMNAAISQLQKMGHASKEKEAALQRAVRTAMSLGLAGSDLADAITFLLHKVLIHTEIEQHPVIESWIQDAVTGRASYADRCAEADSAWWESVQQGAWLGKANGITLEDGHG